jgi:hypothetical protein
MFSIIAAFMLDIIKSTTGPTIFSKLAGDCCVLGW